MHELDLPLPIRSMEFEQLNSPSDNDARLLVLAATSSPVRLYKFLGGPTFEALFAKHAESGTINFQDLGGPTFNNTELRLYRRSLQDRAHSLALLTENGIYHGRIFMQTTLQGTVEVSIVESGMVDYPLGEEERRDSTPLSLALSEFHFVVLYPQRLHVISRLSCKLVQDNILDSSYGGPMKGLLRDSSEVSPPPLVIIIHRPKYLIVMKTDFIIT